MINQLSIYLENTKGSVLRVLSLLAQANNNVLGLVSKDDTEFGTLRLILSDPQGGMDMLQEQGYVCRMSPVLGVELDDTPGALEKMLQEIEYMNINIDYLYVGYARENGAPIIMVHGAFMDAVESNLKRKGYTVH